MIEKPKRLKPTPEVLRELFLKSGNQCAYPGCSALMLDEQGNFIGNICHIEAAEPGGERFNPDMTNEERRSFGNLVLMCYEHHQVTNDIAKYTPEKLSQIKHSHEQLFSSPDRAYRELIENLNWRALVAAGLIAGSGIDNLFNQIREFFKPNDSDSYPKELLAPLRYAPSGRLYWRSSRSDYKEFSETLVSIFRTVGWGTTRISDVAIFKYQYGDKVASSMQLVFVLQDINQVGNAKKAIERFFDICGFRSVAREEEYDAYENNENFSILILVTDRSNWTMMGNLFSGT